MSSILGSQGLVVATAMAVSAGTIVLFDLFKERYFPSTHLSINQEDPQSQKQLLKSCLSSSESKKREGKSKKKKTTKRVQFAEDVRDSTGNGEEYRREHRKRSCAMQKTNSSCGKEILGKPAMPANRMALYSGILRDRTQRMGYSY